MIKILSLKQGGENKNSVIYSLQNVQLKVAKKDQFAKQMMCLNAYRHGINNNKILYTILINL